MDESSVKSNGGPSQRKGRSDFSDLYFARENSKSKEHYKATEHSFRDSHNLLPASQTDNDDREPLKGPYSSSKQNHLYGMTLDKYFGGNFKPLSFERPEDHHNDSAQNSLGAIMMSSNQNPSANSPLSNSEERRNSQANGFLGTHNSLPTHNSSEDKKKNIMKSSSCFNSNEKIYEEEGEIETSSYNGSENFAIAEEEEDLDLSQGSISKKRATPLGNFNKERDPLRKSEPSQPLGVMNASIKLEKKEGRPIIPQATKKQKPNGEVLELGTRKNSIHESKQRRRNKFFEKEDEKENEKSLDGNDSFQRGRYESSEKEVREHSIKEKIQKKYKVHKKSHGGSLIHPPSGKAEGSHKNNQKGSQGLVQNGSGVGGGSSFGTKGSSHKGGVGIRGEVEESSRLSFYVTRNGLRDARDTSGRFKQQSSGQMYLSRHEGFDPQSSHYNPITSNTTSKISVHAFLAKHGSGSKNPLLNQSHVDPNRQTFYERQMEQMRKTNLNKFLAEKNKTDELLRVENENFLNKYSAKFNLSDKEVKALGMPLY